MSGACALVALTAGSPLEFGIAVAFCAAWLIAADFIESGVERDRERAARKHATPPAHRTPTYNPSHVIFAPEAAQRRPRPSAELQRLF
ncbi:hypothetical protein [Mycobacterium cookii]|uniref:hypothetical protein n=1 Tax=Mycobacterium cookii TaxID=1775 RepID=UPI0013D6089C|nr:hypothetical protein [Mycobacterium cookii]MCV7329586.1 hypothetical protein [Mycobacterium cookii]